MRLTFGAFLAAMMLVGCASPSDEKGPNLLLSLPGQVKSEVVRRRAGPQPPVAVTPAMLGATKEAALQVNPLNIGGSDFLKRVARRQDGQPGTVEVWRSGESAQLFLRDGVLIGSRGLGGDILSSDVNVTLRAFAQGGTGEGVRTFVISRGDNASGDLALQCSYRSLGAVKTQVVDRIYDTLHVRESCQNGKIRIDNEYWVQPKSGTMRKSKQWAGPNAGYFEMILLKS